MSGILGTGQGEYQGAIQGLGKSGDLETQRQIFNKQSEQSATQSNIQTGVSGAIATGMIIVALM
jgi:hypothetical protein